jgi:DNA-binding response OmpR family regulator
MKARILLVDDEEKVCASLKHGLEELGHSVECVHTGRDGIEYASSPEYEMIILDVGLPDIDGREVCRIIREKSISTPVLMLTGTKRKSGDKADGLYKGADDYICKPCSISELDARIQALCRRGSSNKSAVIEEGGISLDRTAHAVRVEGRDVELTAVEYEILEYLMSNSNVFLSHEDIARHIWNIEKNYESNPLKVHLYRLRRKLGFANGKCPIENIYGRGYRFVP